MPMNRSDHQFVVTARKPSCRAPRWLLWVFVFALASTIVISGWVGYQFKRGSNWPILFRETIFSDYTSDRSVFEFDPASAGQVGFLQDDPVTVWAAAADIIEQVDYVNQLRQQGVSELDAVARAKAIVFAFSRDGGPQETCGTYETLVDQLQRLPRGEGCCSDHTMVFLALSAIFGLQSREIHNCRHTFNEFYLDEKGGWAWIDPQFSIMAQDADGNWLSLLEMRDMYLNDQQIQWVFFGHETQRFSNSSPYDHVYYRDKTAFTDVYLTMGNNVFEEDQINQRYHYLPRAVRQFFAIITGQLPRRLFYLDEDTVKAPTYQRDKHLYVGGFAFLCIGLSAYPVCSVYLCIRRKFLVSIPNDAHWRK